MSHITLVKQLFELTRSTGYISANPSYHRSAMNTTITLDEDETVNAYADSLSENRHTINIFQGLVDALYFVGIASAVYERNHDMIQLRDACNFVGRNALDGFNQNKTEFGIKELGYDTQINNVLIARATTFMAGGVLSVIAHEQGHICLMHTLRNDIDYDISRNDERQADLFAQSVISALPYKDANILASLFTEILFCWMGKDRGGPATTHPHSRERVFNIYNSHEQYFEAMNFSIQDIEYFLPKKVNNA